MKAVQPPMSKSPSSAPPRANGHAKRPKITVRPTDDELELLHTRAASFGYKSLSKYLIERGLTDGVMIQSADRERIERLLFEVRKLGVNINLIAAQMSRGYSEHSRAQLDRAMQQVERILSEVAGEIVR